MVCSKLIKVSMWRGVVRELLPTGKRRVAVFSPWYEAGKEVVIEKGSVWWDGRRCMGGSNDHFDPGEWNAAARFHGSTARWRG